MSQLSIRFEILSMLLVIGCQGKSDDDKPSPVERVAPDTCLSMSIVGEFPESNREKQTWVYSCFEGYEMWEGHKVFLADSACKNGQTLSNNPDFPFKKLDSKTCPTGASFSCTGDTWKIMGYEQPEGLYSKEIFESYCMSKGGAIQ